MFYHELYGAQYDSSADCTLSLPGNIGSIDLILNTINAIQYSAIISSPN